MRDVMALVQAARRVSTPLVCIRTPDQSQTVRALYRAFSDDPILRWDLARGLVGMNESGRAVRDSFDIEQSNLISPVETLKIAEQFPENTLLIMINYEFVTASEATLQATWNLRDAYKANGRTLVMLAPSIRLPDALANDVIVFDEELPDDEALTEIVTRLDASMKSQVATYPALDQDGIRRAVDAVVGSPAFLAEQNVAMCMDPKTGLDLSQVIERKITMINEIDGLSVDEENLSFESVVGLENAVWYLKRLAENGDIRCILAIDEIEKGVGGYAGDTSGVSQDQMQNLLTWTQKRKARGVMLVGPPGAGKSLLAKALGGHAKAPTIWLDMGALKGSLVGESEAKIRKALATVDAISRGKVFMIATCNSMKALPPELKRRFRRGIIYVDLPTKAEQIPMWKMYGEREGVDISKLDFDYADWTGAEIESCCEIAKDLSCTLAEAARYIVPQAKSAADQIKALREEAHGRYIAASYPGMYKNGAAQPEDATLNQTRKIKL